MMKHKMMAGLAITAIATAALGIPAFAAEARFAAEAIQEIYTVTVKEADGRGTDRTLSDLGNHENGVQYYDTENGSTVSIVQADDTAAHRKLPPQKTDGNGNRYFEMADGSRVYVTQSRGVSID